MFSRTWTGPFEVVRKSVPTNEHVSLRYWILRLRTENFFFQKIFSRKRVLANQRSERCFSQVRKIVRPIRVANNVFSHVKKKWYVQSEAAAVPWFRLKVSAFRCMQRSRFSCFFSVPIFE